MSNYKKLEVSINRDGEVRLAYWDSMYGHDLILLFRNGQWYKQDHFPDDDTEQLIIVNLPDELKAIVNEGAP